MVCVFPRLRMCCSPFPFVRLVLINHLTKNYFIFNNPKKKEIAQLRTHFQTQLDALQASKVQLELVAERRIGAVEVEWSRKCEMLGEQLKKMKVTPDISPKSPFSSVSYAENLITDSLDNNIPRPRPLPNPNPTPNRTTLPPPIPTTAHSTTIRRICQTNPKKGRRNPVLERNDSRRM